MQNRIGSKSDTNSDASPEYYQPISVVVDGDNNSDAERGVEFYQILNGYCVHDGAENRISCLDLNDVVDRKSSDEEEKEEEEVEEMRREDSIQRAFREDENRRNASMMAENATRVMEAMRGVSFGGVAPDWVVEIPQDPWIDQLHRLGQSPNTLEANIDTQIGQWQQPLRNQILGSKTPNFHKSIPPVSQPSREEDGGNGGGKEKEWDWCAWSVDLAKYVPMVSTHDKGTKKIPS